MTALDQLPMRYPKLDATGRLKSKPEDFIVREHLSFSLDGQSGHTYILIEKTQSNTKDVIGLLTNILKQDHQDIGYAGLKDKQSISQQWFSVPGKISDWQLMSLADHANIEVLDCRQHSKKLRIGEVLKNDFEITLREVKCDRDKLVERLNLLAEQGFPNYFGQQRFGHDDSNLELLEKAWPLKDTGQTAPAKLKPFLYSVVRAYLFNCCLAHRLQNGDLDAPLVGDLVMDTDSERCTALTEKELEGESLPLGLTGPLLGRQGFLTQSDALNLEQMACQAVKPWCEALMRSDLNSSRRVLKASVFDAHWQFEEQDILRLKLSLGAGVYATSFVRELMTTS